MVFFYCIVCICSADIDTSQYSLLTVKKNSSSSINFLVFDFISSINSNSFQ